MKKRLPSISTTDYIDDAISMIQERDLGVITAMSGDVKPTEGVVEGMLFNDLKNEELSTYHPIESTWYPLIYYKSGNYTKNTIDKSFEPLSENLTKLSTLEDRGPEPALFSFDTAYPISNFYRELLSTSSASALTSKLSLGALSKFDKISGSTHIQKESITENKTNFASDSFKPFRVGDIVFSAKNTQRDGFIKYTTGTTVGSTNATYSGTKYRELYSELWKNPSVKFVNTAGDSVSKGSSVDADWSANKNIVLYEVDFAHSLYNNIVNSQCEEAGWYEGNTKTNIATGVDSTLSCICDSPRVIRHGRFITLIYGEQTSSYTDESGNTAPLKFDCRIVTWNTETKTQVCSPIILGQLNYIDTSTKVEIGSDLSTSVVFPIDVEENGDMNVVVGNRGWYYLTIIKVNVFSGDQTLFKTYSGLHFTPYTPIYRHNGYYYCYGYKTYGNNGWYLHRNSDLNTLFDLSSRLENAPYEKSLVATSRVLNKNGFFEKDGKLFLLGGTLELTNNGTQQISGLTLLVVNNNKVTYYDIGATEVSDFDILTPIQERYLGPVFCTKKGFLIGPKQNGKLKHVVINVDDPVKSYWYEIDLKEEFSFSNNKCFLSADFVGIFQVTYHVFDYYYYHDEKKDIEYLITPKSIFVCKDGINYSKLTERRLDGHIMYAETSPMKERKAVGLSQYIKY